MQAKGDEYFIKAEEIKPYYLKCFFSYIYFWDSLEKSYEYLKNQLNSISQELKIKIIKIKKIEPFIYMEQFQIIRDFALAHPLSPDEELNSVEKLNNYVVNFWEFSHISRDNKNPENIYFEFGFRTKAKEKDAESFIESNNFQIPDLRIIHNDCIQYFNRFDKACEDKFKKVIEAGKNSTLLKNEIISIVNEL
jgi:hypothetical protein